MTNHEPGGRSNPSHDDPDPVTRTTSARPDEPQLRLRGTGQLLATLPHLLGYRPDHSLVVVVSTPGEERGRPVGRVVLTGRVDLPAGREVDGLLEGFDAPLRQVPLHSRPLLLHVFGYDLPETQVSDDQAPGSQISPQVDAGVAAALEGAARRLARRCDGILHDLVWVRAGGSSAQTVIHGDERVEEPGWEPTTLAADVPAVADLVLEGRGALASRDDVVRQVRRRDESAARATELALRVLSVSPGRLGALEALGALGAWVVDGVEPGPRERARIAVVLQDKDMRDVVMARWVPELFSLSQLLDPEEEKRVTQVIPAWDRRQTVAALDRLLVLASQVPLPQTAPLLTLACGAAWARGQGTLANEACDLALEVDPAYRMAQLLRAALQHGLRPPLGERRAGAPGAGEVGGRFVA